MTVRWGSGFQPDLAHCLPEEEQAQKPCSVALEEAGAGAGS
jgi:hypothetical protein